MCHVPNRYRSLFLPVSGSAGVAGYCAIEHGVISKVPPPRLLALPSPAAATFLATDTAVYMFFYATGVNVGDTFTVTFYGPSGQLYTGSGADSNFQPPQRRRRMLRHQRHPLADCGQPPRDHAWHLDGLIFYNGNTHLRFRNVYDYVLGKHRRAGCRRVVRSRQRNHQPFLLHQPGVAHQQSDAPQLLRQRYLRRHIHCWHRRKRARDFRRHRSLHRLLFVQFQTTTPVQLTGYTLYLADDGTANPASRSATRFTFLAGTSPGALSVISQTNLATLGSSYYQMLGVAPTNGLSTIKVTDTFAAASSYQYFELRFTPNNGTYPGVRVMELVGTGTSGAGICTY